MQHTKGGNLHQKSGHARKKLKKKKPLKKSLSKEKISKIKEKTPEIDTIDVQEMPVVIEEVVLDKKSDTLTHDASDIQKATPKKSASEDESIATPPKKSRRRKRRHKKKHSKKISTKTQETIKDAPEEKIGTKQSLSNRQEDARKMKEGPTKPPLPHYRQSDLTLGKT